MGVISTQGFQFKLVANGTQLDLFKDEEIFISNNVTGLFDLGVLPTDFTRQITVPGTKKNNAFFEHVYDISISNPFLFATNQKVSAYFDFGGIYLSDGYIQLNKVNVIANKYIDSYEITIYGGLASFGRDLKRTFLTDLTSSLAKFNHTSSLENISASWGGNLFSGAIVYPMAEYGQKINYSPEEPYFGIDSVDGAMCVQDYKPAIRIKEVWDAIFDEFAYTYSGSFWNQPWLDNVYMVCNNQLRYPIYEEYNLETYGLFKISPISGSGQTNVTMSAATPLSLPWYNIQENPNNNLSAGLQYTLDFSSRLRGQLNLNFEMKSTGTGNSVPEFYLIIKDLGGTTVSTTALVNYNSYMQKLYLYNSPQVKTETFNLLTEYSTALLPAGTYKFYLQYNNAYTPAPFQIVLDPNNNTNSYLTVNKVNQGGSGLVLDVASNMPYGTAGIKLIDFITSLQKKFNLIIYPNTTKPREFIVETFNNWYKQGEIKSFDKYINLDKPIEVIPANNFAVNELNFGDTLDGDYISQQFQKANSREFGKSYYIDTENFFSQGKFEVKTGLASSPLTYLAGTGLSGSTTLVNAGFQSYVTVTNDGYGGGALANSTISLYTEELVNAYVSVPAFGGTVTVYSPVDAGYVFRNVSAGDQVNFTAFMSGITTSYTFSKIVNGVSTVLATGGSAGGDYTYTITPSDIAATTLLFIANASADIPL